MAENQQREREYMLMLAFQVYAILDEVFLAGEIEETSKQVVLTRLEHLDKLE
jgi:AP-2 complex subunit sigma-1